MPGPTRTRTGGFPSGRGAPKAQRTYPPLGLAASPGDTTASLTWTAVPGANTYSVKRHTVSGGPYSVVGTAYAGSITDTGLTNGTPYYYVVSAIGPSESADSAEVTVTPAA